MIICKIIDLKAGFYLLWYYFKIFIHLIYLFNILFLQIEKKNYYEFGGRPNSHAQTRSPTSKSACITPWCESDFQYEGKDGYTYERSILKNNLENLETIF